MAHVVLTVESGLQSVTTCVTLLCSTCLRQLVRCPLELGLIVLIGADVIVVPSAFMPTTGAAHWHTLLRARAIENQCYVAAPAQTGQHNAKRSSYGHSIAYDPWGEVLFDLGVAHEVVDVFKVDKDAIRKVREKMPMHNRPNVTAFPIEIVS